MAPIFKRIVELHNDSETYRIEGHNLGYVIMMGHAAGLWDKHGTEYRPSAGSDEWDRFEDLLNNNNVKFEVL